MQLRISHIFFLMTLCCSCFSQEDAKRDSLLRAFVKESDMRKQVDLLNVLNKHLRSRNEYHAALDHARAAIRLSAAARDSQGNSVAWHNYGITEYQIGNYPEALRAYFITLKMREDLKDSLGLAKTYGNIGSVYFEQKDYEKALQYQSHALEIDKKLGNKRAQAITTGNMGSAYLASNQLDKASEFCEKALALCNEIGHKPGIANNLGNIGIICELRGDLLRAIEFYQKAAGIDEEIGNRDGVARHLVNMGHAELLLKRYKLAQDHLATASTISYETGSLEAIADVEKTRSAVDSAQGKFHEALGHYKRFIAVRDSIVNEDNTKKQTRLEMQYEFDRRDAFARAEQERKASLVEAEKRRMNIVLAFTSGAGLFILGFALFAWRSFLRKKRSNEEISRQKHVIEEKQKEILDSIRYACRIQSSLMPHEKHLNKELNRLMKNN